MHCTLFSAILQIQCSGGVVALQLVAGDYGEAASQEKNGSESQAKDCHVLSWAVDTYLSVGIGSQSVLYTLVYCTRSRPARGC